MGLPSIKARGESYLLFAILFLGLARGMLYANLLPPWGIIDEEQHLDYIQHIAEEFTLPVVGKTFLSPEIIQSLFESHRWDTFHWPAPASPSPKDLGLEAYSYEGYQPPLYYVLLAPIFRLIPGTILFKLFFLRWMTVLLSLLTVWIAIRWTKELFPSQAYLPYFVGLILVLIPERTMATSRINNDSLLEVLGAIFLWLSTRSLSEGLTPSRSRWMALFFGLGMITKVSMAGLGLILFLVIWKNRRRPGLVKSFLWMAGILMVIGLPLLIYNLKTYGDLTGISGFKRLMTSAGGLPVQAVTISDLLKAFTSLFTNFWVIWWKQAGIGSNLILSGFYILLAGLTVASVFGMFRTLLSKQNQHSSQLKPILGSYIFLIGFYAFIVLSSYFAGGDGPLIHEPEIQGRFFLPVIVPMVILFCAGLYSLSNWKWHFMIAVCLILLAADGLNFFGNLLRQFYYWAWFYKNGAPIPFPAQTLQEGLKLFITRFWMDKPGSIRTIIYAVLPLYLVSLAVVFFAFLRVKGFFKAKGDGWHIGETGFPGQTPQQKWTHKYHSLLRDPLLWITVALFLLYIVVVAIRPQGIFWSLDEGGKFIYLQSVLKSGNPAGPLYYPGRTIDPQAHFIPLFWQVRVSDTEIYSWWPVGFPLITIPFYLIFGWLGLYIFPAISGATASLLTGLIIRQLLPGSKRLDLAAATLVGVGTPMFFYSTMFWEHTLSAAFLISSIYCLLIGWNSQTPRKYLWILAGGLASISAFFRIEALPLAAGIGLVLLFTRFWRAVEYGSGFVIISLPWLAANKILMGDFLTRFMTNIDAQGWFIGFKMVGIKLIPYALFNAPLIQALPIGGTLQILGSSLVVLALITPFLKRFYWVGMLAYLGLFGISLWALLNPWGYRSVHGFLLIAPVVIFFPWFWTLKSRHTSSFISLAFLCGLMAYSVVYLLRMWPAGGGQQWGPRYQLALYPLLVIASLVGLAQNWDSFGKYLRIGIFTLFIAQAAVGVGFEIRGIYWAQKAAEYYDASRAAIRALPEKPITTDCTFLPMIIPEFYEKGNIFNRGGIDLKVWAKEVKSTGVNEFYDIQVDVCAYDHLDKVVKNRASNPTGLIIHQYRTDELIK